MHELETRADQLVRIQEYAAAEELYSEILNNEPKNQTVQQKLTDLQWKKRGVTTSTDQQGLASTSSNRIPLASQRAFSQSSYRPNQSASTPTRTTPQHSGIDPDYELEAALFAKPRTVSAPLKTNDSLPRFDRNQRDEEIPAWAKEDPLTAQQERTASPIPPNHARPNLGQPNPRLEDRPQLRDDSIRNEQPVRQARRPVAQDFHTPTPTSQVHSEDWTISITPKSKKQQYVHFGSRRRPGVISMKSSGLRTVSSDSHPGDESQAEAPAIATVRNFAPQYTPSTIHPISESSTDQSRSESVASKLESAQTAALKESLTALSDEELQEFVLSHAEDAAAINEAIKRLGNPNQETRWQAANAIEVLVNQPKSESLIVAGFARALTGSDPILSEQVLNVLHGLPKQAELLRALIQTKLDDDNEHVRAAAAGVLNTLDR